MVARKAHNGFLFCRERAVVARRDLTATLEVLWIGFFKRTTHFHTFFCGLV